MSQTVANGVASPNRRRKWFLLGGVMLLTLLAIVVYFNISIFVIQPIGALPEGRTIILWRRGAALNFVDSADGFCEREQGGVSLLCRIGAINGVLQNNPILVRLPFNHTLYSISTDGREYDR